LVLGIADRLRGQAGIRQIATGADLAGAGAYRRPVVQGDLLVLERCRRPCRMGWAGRTWPSIFLVRHATWALLISV
jgi:hypothetical protein